jgi:hypothetical protein
MAGMAWHAARATAVASGVLWPRSKKIGFTLFVAAAARISDRDLMENREKAAAGLQLY